MKNIFKSRFSNKDVIFIDESSGHPNGLQTFEDMKRIILRERARSDRQNHEFSVVVIDIEKFDKENGFLDHLYQRLSKRLRLIDEIGWYDNDDIAIVLPYTSSKNAVRVAEDVLRIINEDVPAHISKILSYPSVWPYKK